MRVNACCMVLYEYHRIRRTYMPRKPSRLPHDLRQRSCLQDIHPEHHCSSGHHCCGGHQEHGCCGHTADSAFESSSCCSDDFVVLSLTGTAPSSEETGCCLCHCWHGPAEVSVASLHHLLSFQEINRIIQEPDSGVPAPGDVQSLLGIWRI